MVSDTSGLYKKLGHNASSSSVATGGFGFRRATVDTTEARAVRHPHLAELLLPGVCGGIRTRSIESLTRICPLVLPQRAPAATHGLRDRPVSSGSVVPHRPRRRPGVQITTVAGRERQNNLEYSSNRHILCRALVLSPPEQNKFIFAISLCIQNLSRLERFYWLLADAISVLLLDTRPNRHGSTIVFLRLFLFVVSESTQPFDGDTAAVERAVVLTRT